MIAVTAPQQSMIHDLHATVGLVDVRSSSTDLPQAAPLAPGSVRVTTATMATYDISAVGTISEAGA